LGVLLPLGVAGGMVGLGSTLITAFLGGLPGITISTPLGAKCAGIRAARSANGGGGIRRPVLSMRSVMGSFLVQSWQGAQDAYHISTSSIVCQHLTCFNKLLTALWQRTIISSIVFTNM